MLNNNPIQPKLYYIVGQTLIKRLFFQTVGNGWGSITSLLLTVGHDLLASNFTNKRNDILISRQIQKKKHFC